MDYRIEKKETFALVGYKKQFKGELSDRAKQEEEFWINTRSEQDVLLDIRSEPEIWYDINTNFTEDGYDHYIAVKTDKNIPDSLEEIIVPALTYAIFKTEKNKFPTRVYMDLRKKIVSEWLPSSEYLLAEGPEITVCHWFKNPNAEKRYIELWMPVEMK